MSSFRKISNPSSTPEASINDKLGALIDMQFECPPSADELKRGPFAQSESREEAFEFIAYLL